MSNTYDDVIDLEQYSISDKKPPVGKKYQTRVDNIKVVFDKAKVTGKEVLEKACKIPVECFTLYLKLKGCDFEKVDLDEIVDLTKHGTEHFITKPPEVFYYDLDDEPETTDLKEMTPNQILKAGGVNPQKHYLVQIFPDGTQESYKGKGDVPLKMKCPRAKFISVLDGPTPVSNFKIKYNGKD